MCRTEKIAIAERLLRRPGTRVFFCGIGGAGMNALAHLLARSGLLVSGADIAEQKSLSALRAAGISCAVGHDPRLVDDAELFVYSSAIAPDNPQRERAEARGIPCIRRGELLAMLVNQRRGVTVAATHGKTTTAALTAVLFAAGGLDPSAVIGGDVPEFGGYFRYGGSEWIVVETDESDGSFELLTSEIGLMLNIDADHLDFYSSEEEIEAAFARYAAHIRREGVLIYNGDDAKVARVAGGAAHVTTRVACALENETEVRAGEIELRPWSSAFTVTIGKERFRVTLGIPGRHNVSNALHAIAAARQVGIATEVIQEVCASFRGVRRRMERVGSFRGALVIDDYAHHPREIAATLAAVRQLGRPLIVVFQPHRYTRTAALLEEFVSVLASEERVIITEVYSAGEPPGPVTGVTLWEAVRQHTPGAVFAPTLEAIKPALQRLVGEGDVIVFLGAGSISQVAHEVVESVEEVACPHAT
ncbi:MAG: UDP-N-acetylmuramate--L-alanine ligase [bacterium]|nr:UDP-N-acetylmuramate--L-alanine ligase [bacterium]